MVLTVYDKWASVNKTKARVRERNLLLVSLLGENSILPGYSFLV